MDCNPQHIGECGCPELYEGGGMCIGSGPCGEPCPNGSGDCPSGKACFVNTCCLEPAVCLWTECPIPITVTQGIWSQE